MNCQARFSLKLALMVLLPVAIAGCSTPQATPSPSFSPLPSPPAISTVPTLPASPPNSAAAPLILKALDGKTEITLPGTWKAQTNLNPEAKIQAADWSKGLYLIIVSDPKANLNQITLEQHSQRTRELLVKNLVGAKTSEPTDVKLVNGKPAVQYEISGSLNNLTVQFLHTTVETSENFVQILTWATPEAYTQNKTELQKIIQSFQAP